MSAGRGARRGGGRAPVVLAVLGLLAASVAAFVLGTPALTVRGARAATLFLDAWRHKLEGTYVVEASVTRSTAGGSGLNQGLRIVQRPPDRLLVGLGNVSGRTVDSYIRCPTEPSGTSQCFTSPGAPPYADDVAAELDALRSYVTGDRPLYTVIAFGNDCFRLDLALQLPSPPYGQHSLFCFDEDTGAPTRTVTEYGDVTERTVAVAIRTDVTDQDIQVPADRGELQEVN